MRDGPIPSQSREALLAPSWPFPPHPLARTYVKKQMSSLVGLAAGTVLEGATIALLTQAGGISRTNVRAPGVERRGFADNLSGAIRGERLDDANAVDGLDW